MGFAAPGDAIVLLGTTKEELGGSAWEDVMHDHHLGGLPPFPDFPAERALAAVCRAGAGVLTSAHDLSEGGLAQSLVDCCLRRGLGAAVALPGGLDPCAELFSESPARAIVSVAPERQEALLDLCAEHELPAARIGEVTQAAELAVEGLFTLPLSRIREVWRDTVPDAMQGV